MAAVKRKRCELENEVENEVKYPDIRIYIMPQRLQKARMDILKKAARKKGFLVEESFNASVTHVVSQYDSAEKILQALKRFSDGTSTENVELVNVNWLTACTTWGSPVPITESHRIKFSQQKTQDKPSGQSSTSRDSKNPSTTKTKDVKYICQRTAPLDHPNKIFTDALEVLERHAIYKDSSQRDTRALAFRRAACSLKSLPKVVSKMQDVANLSHLGNHSRKVIQEILEKGFCDEVEEIRKSDFFNSMEKFSPVYGCGPATGRKWFEEGYRSIEDVRQALKDKKLKVTDQQLVGIHFYESVVNGVSRSEADTITKLVTVQLDDLEPGCTIQLVGGYRRGKTSGHDVDILITHPDDDKISQLLMKLVNRLDHLGHIVHKDVSVGKNSIHRTDSSKKTVGGVMDQLDHCFCMFKMDTSYPDEEVSPVMVRRVDLIVAPLSQYPWALLGWTGSKQFNRSLRLYASKELNIAVSNHGAWDRNKVGNAIVCLLVLAQYKSSRGKTAVAAYCQGFGEVIEVLDITGLPVPPQLIEATNEKEIFTALNLTYREPEERNC